MDDIKKCFKCQKNKLLALFYKHNGMADGHLNKCKECAKKDAVKRLQTKSSDLVWLESERQRGREKYHRLGYRDTKVNKEAKARWQKNYKNNYPEKIAAQKHSGNLFKKGYEKHHWSYNKESYKDVIWLTTKAHNTLHRYLEYDKQFFLYRTATGRLLKTKESHEYLIENMNLNVHHTS